MGDPRIVSDRCTGELDRVVPKDIQTVTIGLERILQRLNGRLHLGFGEFEINRTEVEEPD
jgi:hypothetical protein